MPSESAIGIGRPRLGRICVPCASCGKERMYNDSDAGRRRVTDLCQPCAVADYNASRPRADPERKRRYRSEYFQKNKRQLNIYYAGYREQIRLEMVAAFGGRCVHCGEADPVVLVLDHINNDARADRQQNRHKGGFKMYCRLRAAGWPKDRHQLLCHNCNYRKEHGRRHALINTQAS